MHRYCMRASPFRADSNDDATFQELLDAIAQSSSAAASTAASAAPSALQAKLRSSANERQPHQLELSEVVDIVDEPAPHNRHAPRASCVAAAAGDSSSSSDDALAVSSLVKRVTQVSLQLRLCVLLLCMFSDRGSKCALFPLSNVSRIMRLLTAVMVAGSSSC